MKDDLTDIPLGTKVLTPSGKEGVVTKHITTSKTDRFSRVCVRFGFNPDDTVVLQPSLLTIIERYKWKSPDDETIAMRVADL